MPRIDQKHPVDLHTVMHPGKPEVGDAGPVSGGVDRAVLANALRRAMDCLTRLGPEHAAEAVNLDQLGDRLAEGRLRLAVLGQFKRGKSTLLNALLGADLLPRSIVPLTAIPTFIQWGKVCRARVVYTGERPGEELSDPTCDALKNLLVTFATETHNPKNCRGVQRIEIFYPAPLLEHGVVLIDTPGIGSVYRHNTDTATGFLPQCDAALFLVSTDPAITDVEVQFLKQVRSLVPKLFFIMNKIDYLDLDERKVAVDFLRKVLHEQAGLENPIEVFEVSARQGLRAIQSGDVQQWVDSGLEQIGKHLLNFLIAEKEGVLLKVLTCRTLMILDTSLLRLRLFRKSLELPLDELRRRRDRFELQLQEIKQDRESAQDLLAGDRHRLREFLEEHMAELRHEIADRLQQLMQKEIAAADPQPIRDEHVRMILSSAVPALFDEASERMTSRFSHKCAEVLGLHWRKIESVIEAIRSAAAELFEVPYRKQPGSERQVQIVKPYWVNYDWLATRGVLTHGWFEKLLPIAIRRKRATRRCELQVQALVTKNVENLRWPLLQSLNATVNRFGSQLDELYLEALETTRGAIETVIRNRVERTISVAQDQDRISGAIRELESIRAELGPDREAGQP